MESGNELYLGRCQLCDRIDARFLVAKRVTNLFGKEAGLKWFVETYCERCVKHAGVDAQIVEVLVVVVP